MTRAPGVPRQRAGFGEFVRSSGKLAAARQLSALLFIGAVLALPLLATRGWVTEFVWSYFSMLTLTSLLGLGLERLAGALAVDGDDAPLGALFGVRLASIPAVAAAQWVLLTFVGVTLSPLAWVATLVWTVAALIEPIAFGALRTRGDSMTEPCTALVMRVVQASSLLAAAAAGAPLALALVGVAACEVGAVGVALRAVGPSRFRGMSRAGIAGIPWRRVAWLAGVELVALAYLRADLLIVGRILGPGAGAAYGMLYRVIDGIYGLVGSAGLWLYAETVHEPSPDASHELRDRSLALVPMLATAVGFALVLAAQILGDVVGSVGNETRTLQLLIAAFPLLAVNTIELHVRSGQGRNRGVVGIGLAALALNVAACIALIPPLGLQGAALALLASELLQTALADPGLCASRASSVHALRRSLRSSAPSP